jgi:hypothetical protein
MGIFLKNFVPELTWLKDAPEEGSDKNIIIQFLNRHYQRILNPVRIRDGKEDF